MASDLSLSLTLSGSDSITGTVGLATPTAGVTIGSGTFDAMSLSYSYGDATDKVEQWCAAEFTLAAGASLDLDLKAMTNSLTEAVDFAAIKTVLVAIDSPDGTKKLRVGPQGVTNGWVGPFKDAADWKEIVDFDLPVNNRWAGYPVAALTKVLRLHNPGAGSVTARYLIAGTV